MRFSIIIPAHNAEDRIRKCLDSVKQQVFKDYELIVVCDACEDKTDEIAKEYGARVEYVNFHQDGYTRNRGLDVAQGDWVLFIDDDDWWLHEYVLTMLDEKITKNPNFDVICFSFIFKHWKYATPNGNNGGRWIAVWNKCWRRSFIGNTRFSNDYSVSDVYFNNKMMAKRPRILDWDVLMYYYNYLRPGSISQTCNQTVPEYN